MLGLGLLVVVTGCSNASRKADGPILSVDGELITTTSTTMGTSPVPSSAAPAGSPAPSAAPAGQEAAANATVPQLVGLTVGAAEQALVANGLRSLYLRVDDWTVARDVVVSQVQPAGSSMPSGGVVTFRVSNGPADVLVPIVIGQCMSDAQARLTAAGFPSQVFYRVDPAKFHRVISSSPAGIVARQGSMVTMYVSTSQVQDGCN